MKKRIVYYLTAMCISTFAISLPTLASEAPNKVSDISYNPISQSVNISTDNYIKPNVFEVSNPPAVIIEFPGTANSFKQETLLVNHNYIRNVKVEETKGKEPVTRIHISLEKKVKFDLASSFKYNAQTLEFITLESKPEKDSSKYASTAVDIKTGTRLASKAIGNRNDYYPGSAGEGVNTALQNKTIIVDAGHGGNDPGAVGKSGLQEKSVTLGISKYLHNKLENAGANSILSRNNDSEILLQPRLDVAHRQNADLFVSIHVNSATNSNAKGIETYYKTPQSAKLASLVHKHMVNELPATPNRGVKSANFYVIKRTEVPSILVETGFISNPAEEMLLAAAQYQHKIADAIYRGISEFFSTTKL